MGFGAQGLDDMVMILMRIRPYILVVDLGRDIWKFGGRIWGFMCRAGLWYRARARVWGLGFRGLGFKV